MSLRYRTVAEALRSQIELGNYRAGDRLPSVREAAAQFEVSVSTVVEAYRILAESGAIHSRPKSGFFVALTPHLEPQQSRPAAKPFSLERNRLVASVIEDMALASGINLGCALPNQNILPVGKLRRFAQDALREFDRGFTGYPPSEGSRELREQIAQRAFRRGAAVSADEVVVTAGCQEALTLTLRAIGRSPGVVLVESPTFFGVLESIESAGHRALPVPTCPREGIDPADLVESVRSARAEGHQVVAAILTSNVQNPLGYQLADRRKAELVAAAEAIDLPIIEDDVYGELSFDEERPRLLRSFATSGTIITCSSISKTVTPGWRIGWVIAGAMADQVREQKYLASIGQPEHFQVAIARFLAEGAFDRLLRTSRELYRGTVANAIRAVVESFPRGTSVTRPHGGFVIWIECPRPMNSGEVYWQARSEGIFIAPGSIFGGEGEFDHCLRLNVSRFDGQVARAIARIGELVRG